PTVYGRRGLSRTRTFPRRPCVSGSAAPLKCGREFDCRRIDCAARAAHARARSSGPKTRRRELMKIAPRRVLPPAALLMAGLLHGTPAQAQEGLIAPGTETWEFGLGGVLNEGSTRLRLDSPSGRSGEVNLEDVTGLDRNKSSIFVLATWRFAANHRIGIQGFEVKRDADKVIERDIEFRDQVIHAG